MTQGRDTNSISGSISRNKSNIHGSIDSNTPAFNDLKQQVERNTANITQHTALIERLSNSITVLETKVVTIISKLIPELQEKITKFYKTFSAEINKLSARIDSLRESLDEEARIRANADTVLQNNIYAEARIRAEADNELQNKISLEESARILADAALQAGKLDIMPGDAYTAGNPYNLPYYFKTEADNSKIKVIAETVTLDGNKVHSQYSIDVNSATNTLAGLMSAGDKTTLDVINSDYLKSSDKIELQNNINIEAATRASEDAKKVDKEITSTTGKAIIFNEADGGGAKYEHTDGLESFVGVNNGGSSGIAAQIYADKLVDGKWSGSKLDVTNNGIYYTVGNKTPLERDIPTNELAVKGDITTDNLIQGKLTFVIDCGTAPIEGN